MIESMIKTLCIYIILLLVTSNACAFQFEGNRWGSGVENEYNTIKAGKHDVERGEYYIKYEDTIFEKNCSVKFYFTAQTKVLARISIEWKGDVGAQIKKKIIERYGSPNESDDTLKQFVWEEGRAEQDERMVFNYGFNLPATLNYYGGVYWRKYQDERKELFRTIPSL